MATVTLVIATYKEDLEWLHEFKNNSSVQLNIYIYLKDSTREIALRSEFSEAIIEVLPNIGREAHTYLYHICKYYTSLDNYLVFLQGNPWDHILLEQLYTVVHGENRVAYMPMFKNPSIIYTCDKYGQPDHFLENELEKYYTQFCNDTIPEIIKFYPGAQFGISKNIIVSQDIAFYNALLEGSYTNNLSPYVYERLWGYFFNVYC